MKAIKVLLRERTAGDEDEVEVSVTLWASGNGAEVELEIVEFDRLSLSAYMEPEMAAKVGHALLDAACLEVEK